MALGGGDRDRMDLAQVVERDARPDEQAVFDVDHDLALDQQVVIEGQRVLREVDHALDRVLDRDDADIDLTLLDGIEHVGHRAVRDVLGVDEVGLRQQGLLCEGSERSEEPHAFRHGREGYGSPGRRASFVSRRATMSAMDEGTPAGAARRRAVGHHLAGRCGRRRCAAFRSPTSRARRSTTTAISARACPKRSTDRASRRRSAWPSSANSCTNGTGPVLLTRTDPEQRAACIDAHGAAAEASGTMAWRLPDGAVDVDDRDRHRRHERHPGRRRSGARTAGIRSRTGGHHRRRRRRAAPPPRPPRRHHRRRCDHRDRRDGGGARERHRRPQPARRSSPSPPASATARGSTG